MYAVHDQIDVSSFSDVSKFSGIETVNVKDILSVTTDLESLKKNVTTLLSRVVRKYMPYFRKHADAKAILQHI